MADFVVYHAPERMGYSADTVHGFGLLTKNVPSVVGSRVWLLTGEGRLEPTISEAASRLTRVKRTSQPTTRSAAATCR
jgi:hypothetical protein